MRMLKQFLNDESGATAVEYALIAGLISIAIISGARAIGLALDNQFGNTSTALDEAGT